MDRETNRGRVPRFAKKYLIDQHIRRIERLTEILTAKNESVADPMSWTRANRWINAYPWSYENAGPIVEYGIHDKPSQVFLRPYLDQYLTDFCRDKSVTKPRQSELTENQINENLFLAIIRGAKISHIFPTDRMGYAISKEKIRPAIYESSAIHEILSGPGAVGMYQFRSGGIYTVHGALQKAGGRAGSRDVLVFDEYDFMPSGVFGVFEQLISHSSMRLVRKISTPTTPETGIDREVKTGCGFEWFIKCPKCKKVQAFTWPDNLIGFFEVSEFSRDDPEYEKRLAQVYIGCQHCGAYIDRNTEHYARTSAWVAQRPQLVGEKNSYFINAFMIPWKTGRELLRRYHQLSAYVWQWYNEVLGVAYLKGDNRLGEHEILACQGAWQMTPVRVPTLSNVSIGVDWGEKQSWVVVSASGMDSDRGRGVRSVVYIEEINEDTLKAAGFPGVATDHVLRVKQLVELFHADIVVNDANGIGIDRNRHLIDRYPDRAWGCFFDTAEAGKQLRQSKLIIPEFTPAKRKVRISKTFTVKLVQNEFRARTIEIPAMDGGQADIVRKFVRHNMALAVQPRWDPEYEKEFEITVKMAQDDHLFDANMYSKVGWDRLTGGGQGAPIGMIRTAI